MEALKYLLLIAFKLCTFLGMFYLLAWFINIPVELFKVFRCYRKWHEVYWEEFKSHLNLFKVFKKQDLKNKKEPEQVTITRILIVFGILGILYSIIPYTPIANETMGSIFEKEKYTNYYYVNMFTDIDESKNYKVKAEIVSFKNTYEYDDDKETIREYHVSKVLWPNGGCSSFDYLNWDEDNSLSVGKKVYIKDEDDKEWYIELTNQKIEN